MSTSNFYDIPDFYREKLNIKFQSPEVESESDCSGQELEENIIPESETTDAESESVLVYGEQSPETEEVMAQGRPGPRPGCRGRNCPPPMPPGPGPGCRGGNCPPPMPPGPRPGCRGRNCPPPPRPPRPPFPQYPFHPCPMGTFCRRDDNMMPPMPFFKTFPGSLRLQEEADDMQDMDKLQERYPKNAKIIKMLVEEQADRMDYDGSMMFDETPDKVRIEKIVDEIFDRLKAEMQEQNEEGDCELCDNSLDENTLKELITVLLYQEMYRI